MDVSKLKVVELRAELSSRGLDQKGNKPVLVARLLEAIEKEEQLLKSDDEGDEDVPLSEAKGEQPREEVTDPPPIKSPTPEETSALSAASNTSQQEEDSSQFASFQEESESKPEESEVKDVVHVAEESREQIRDEESRGSESVAIDETSVQSSLAFDSNSELNDREDEKREPVIDQNSSSASKEPESNDDWGKRETDSSDAAPRPSLIHDDSNAQDALDAEQTLRAAEKSEMEVDKAVEDSLETAETESDVQKDPSDPERKEETEVEDKQPRERRRNRWGDADPVEGEVAPAWQSQEAKDSQPDDEKMDDERGSRKRERERSVEPHIPSPPRRPDNEPFFDEKDVLLSWYDSDLHLIIDKDNFFSATMMTTDGFGYVWAGVRATYGFQKGKVYYEAKATQDLDASEVEDEPNPHVLRVGWSIVDSSLQLGEYPLSYGYGSTGKISTNCNFQDYGKSFGRGDVIGCYLDLDSSPYTITYTLNGEDLGVAFTIEPEELNGQALFPHILSKNQAFHVNFGEQEPWGTPLPDYTYIGKVPVDDRVAGPKRPEKRDDCEVIMMVGLPGAGKTTWASKYASEHRDKRFNILGTNELLDRMKVMGLPRKRNYSGRWDHLINKCTRCLQTLLDIGCQRRRNYIIDQTNVYPTAQRRKIRGFEGFMRRAVVIVPPDEEFKARTANRQVEEGKEVPESAVLDMKANFVLPEKSLFNSIEFVELQEEDAATLIKTYNKEGNDAGFESKFASVKRPRNDEYERHDRDRGERSRGGYGGSRGNNYGRGGRGGYDRGNRNGSYSDRGNNYNDRNRYGDRSGYGGSGGGGGHRGDRRGNDGNWRFNSRPRNDDRGGWNNGSRGGGGGGGGGNWRDNRGGSGNNWSGNRYGGNKDDRSGRGRDDRSSEKDKRPGGQGNWNQGPGGYQQGWQGFGGQWGNWNQQGYGGQQQAGGQQPWKNYNQGWAQQTWNNQNWANWNQQYYNQAYQQGWGQQSQQAATAATTDTTQTPATYSYSQTAATTTAGSQAASWPGYATGYNASEAQGSATNSSYSSSQK